MSKTFDVIISGAGPVGLFLACELALAKCSVLVLEKTLDPHSPLKRAPFGIRGLSALSVEALDRRGLLNELKLHKRIKSPHQNSGVGSRRQVGHFAGIPFHEGDIDVSRWTFRLPTSTPTNLISEMEEIETILTSRAEKLGVDIKRGVAITSFEQTDASVVARSGDQTFNGLFLVGCDGAHSVVRKNGGFEFAGTEPDFTGYSTQVEIADSSMLKPGRNVTAVGMYMQSQPGYVIMQDFDGGAFHHLKEPITREHVESVLRRISGTDVTVNALHLATTWTDRTRQATTYRNGRVLLAGDAAHIHSPLGGQGLNLGLGDAMNLGWKLAATIHQQAPYGLLESYQSERHPLGEQVLNWSRAQVAIMKPDPSARALNDIFRDIMKTQDASTYFAARVWGIGTRYNLGDDHPLVGCSTPNFEFEDGRTVGGLLREGRGLLLDFEGHDSLQSMVGDRHEKLNYFYLRAVNQLGLRALLLRPDGIVAWVSETETNALGCQRAIDRWFV